MRLLKISFSFVVLTFCVKFFGCSRILLNRIGKTVVVTRTMDCRIDDSPELWLCPRGMQVDGGTEKNSLSWISKYGSLLIKAWNKEAIFDGINEHGLSVNLLYLGATEYEPEDDRPTVSTAVWIRYFLDNFKTVKEAVANLDDFRLVSVKIYGDLYPLHIALSDATGDSAIVEYINGKLTVHHGPEYVVMTNDPIYSEQLKNMQNYEGLGGTLPLPGSISSKDRFVRANYFLQYLPVANSAVEAVAYAFDSIYNVSRSYSIRTHSANPNYEKHPTWWVTVADLTNKVYYFRYTKKIHTIWFDMKHLNFECSADPMKLDLKSVERPGESSAQFESLCGMECK